MTDFPRCGKTLGRTGRGCPLARPAALPRRSQDARASLHSEAAGESPVLTPAAGAKWSVLRASRDSSEGSVGPAAGVGWGAGSGVPALSAGCTSGRSMRLHIAESLGDELGLLPQDGAWGFSPRGKKAGVSGGWRATCPPKAVSPPSGLLATPHFPGSFAIGVARTLGPSNRMRRSNGYHLRVAQRPPMSLLLGSPSHRRVGTGRATVEATRCQ